MGYFTFCGRVVGKAIFDGELLDCHFTRAFYKQILGVPVSWKDMEAVDKDIYNNLVWILNNDVSVLGLTFSTDVERFGEVKTVDLKPGGQEMDVTDENSSSTSAYSASASLSRRRPSR